MNSQVVAPDWRFYSLPRETIDPIKSIVELAKLDVFRQVLAMPFQTYFITADAIGAGTWDEIAAREPPRGLKPADQPLSEASQSNMYWQIHDLAYHLLTTYEGTGKIFILQNHEADWHLVASNDPRLDPSDVALANALRYFQVRQQAVNDARRKARARGVYVYHLCEVNLVAKAMTGGKTVTNNVLPGLDCDLVGYSSWDVCSKTDGSALQAVNFLRSKAKDSFAFGNNNVVITEMGVPEQQRNDVAPELRFILESLTTGCPWVVQWTLYDNDCSRMENGRKTRVFNPTPEDCIGAWIRRPDGHLGRFFHAFHPYLLEGPANPEPTDSTAYTVEIYRLLLGRKPDPTGLANAVRRIDEAPWIKELVIADLLISPEYRQRTGNSSAAVVYDTYRTVLGRNPEPAVAGALALNLRNENERNAFLNSLLGSLEAQQRYVDWLYRRYTSRPPQPHEKSRALDMLQRGMTRQQLLTHLVTTLRKP
jgi:hypothetical protein